MIREFSRIEAVILLTVNLEPLAAALAAESLSAPQAISPDTAWITVPNEGVPSLWWRLRKALHPEGWCPIIAGNPAELDTWLCLGVDEMKRPLPEPSEAAYTKFLNGRRREMMEEIGDPDMVAELKVDRAGLEIPAEAVRGEFVALHEMGSRQPWPEVAIAFVRTDEAWKIPHVLPWGGFNEAPHPSELALTFWSWQQRFGAIPAAFTSDTIELFLQKPLTDTAQVVAVAEEMVIMAPDIVWQGTETTTALASEMANRHIWFMWWD
jgi:hypothetical protein